MTIPIAATLVAFTSGLWLLALTVAVLSLIHTVRTLSLAVKELRKPPLHVRPDPMTHRADVKPFRRTKG